MTPPANKYVNMLKHLQQLTESTDPTNVQIAAAQAALDDAISNERFTTDLRSLTTTPADDDATPAASSTLSHTIAEGERRSQHWRWIGVAAAVSVLVASIAALSLVVNSQPVTALGSIVKVVEILPPDAFGDPFIQRDFQEDRLVVSVFDDASLPAIQPVTRIERFDADGNIEITETFGEPILLNLEDAPYLEAVRDELAAGETITTVATPPDGDNVLMLTDSADELAERMRDQYSRFADPSVPFEAYAMDQITSIYLATVPTPTQRAAMIALIDNLPAVTQTSIALGVITQFEYLGATGRERIEMRFDNTGWLTESALTLIDGSTIDRIPPNTRTTIHLIQPEAFDRENNGRP